MRRIVATLLVVAGPAVLAPPVGAGSAGVPGGPALPAAAVLTPALPAPALPSAPAVQITPIAPRVAPVAVPAVHSAVTRVKSRAVAVDDAAYRARLQAELCAARAIFCGLDSNGRYPTR